MKMPNIRKCFIPDPGMTLFEADLQGADARVVAWEADDEALKAAFRLGIDIHAHNARDIWPTAAATSSDLAAYKTDFQLKSLRQRAKIAIHAVDYGCKEATLAEHIQCDRNTAAEFISRWFYLHPRILEWHRLVERQLYRTRTVSNIYGFKRRYFDRVEGLLPEALAWIGQSTTAIAINKLIVTLAARVAEIEFLLQTHDSVTFQIPTATAKDVLTTQILPVCNSLLLPYPDPMRMPVEVLASTESWGDVHAI